MAISGHYDLLVCSLFQVHRQLAREPEGHQTGVRDSSPRWERAVPEYSRAAAPSSSWIGQKSKYKQSGFKNIQFITVITGGNNQHEIKKKKGFSSPNCIHGKTILKNDTKYSFSHNKKEKKIHPAELFINKYQRKF